MLTFVMVPKLELGDNLYGMYPVQRKRILQPEAATHQKSSKSGHYGQSEYFVMLP